MPTLAPIDQTCVSALRFLSVDAVEAANSGHPGLPLGAAPMAYALFDRVMRYNASNPNWVNRDRFILSAGHGSALLYALLHCYGFGLPLDELKRFRQMGSKTPGHPEYGHTVGVEATTGPLGAGFSMGVGMAIAESKLRNRFGSDAIDHFIYAIVSDGDLMEGISGEAASLAGHLRLGKLIYLYDDNRISLDGPTHLSFTEDVETRFVGYGWQVLHVEEGNSVDEVERAVRQAQMDPRPTLIRVRTNIGYGSPKQDTEKAHGSPLGAEATRATKEKLGWPVEPAFYVPDEARAHFEQVAQRGKENELAWSAQFAKWAANNPSLAAEFDQFVRGELPSDWSSEADALDFGDKPIATRASGSKALSALARKVPFLIGGAADLSESTKTNVEGEKDYQPTSPEGRNLYFGVREHAMGGAVNGLALSGMIAYGSTFLVFSDYMRGAVRLSALMGIHSIFVFTHDSVCVGEDGPTHEPVEHVSSLRLIPGLAVYRPGDAYESVECWKQAVAQKRPSTIILSRQNLPVQGASREAIRAGVPKGAYILREASGGTPKVVLLAAGSEVSLALSAADTLELQGTPTRVVSMPCWELFEEQDATYQQSVLGGDVARVSIEAGVTAPWYRWLGGKGEAVGIDRFGLSAPGDLVYKELGMNVEAVVAAANRALAK